MVDLSAFLAATGQLGQANALVAARQEEKRRRKEAERAAMFRTVGTVAGAALGFYGGGAPGMAVGASIGNMAGGAAAGQPPSALEVAQTGAQGYGMYQQGQQRNAEMAALKALDAQRTSDRSTMPGQQGILPADYERIVALQAGQRSSTPLTTTANVLSIAQSLQPPPPPKPISVSAGGALVDPKTFEEVYGNRTAVGDDKTVTLNLEQKKEAGIPDPSNTFAQQKPDGTITFKSTKKDSDPTVFRMLSAGEIAAIPGADQSASYQEDVKTGRIYQIPGTGEKTGAEMERNIKFLTDLRMKRIRGEPVSKADWLKENLVRQRLERPFTIIDALGNKTTYPGLDFTDFDKGGEIQPTQTGRGDPTQSPLPTPDVRSETTNPMNPTDAAKTAALKQAVGTVQYVRGRIINDDGSINWKNVAAMQLNVWKSEGKTLRQNLADAIESKLRAESGQAVPPEERKNMLERYLPALGDTPEGIASKFDRMQDYLDGTISLIEFGRGVLSENTVQKIKSQGGAFSAMSDAELIGKDLTKMTAKELSEYDKEMKQRGF